MIKSKGRFVFNFKKEDEEFVKNLDIEILNNGYKRAKNFFEYQGDIQPIRICFVYSPEEYLFFSGYPEYKNWMRACTGYHNTIYIFSPSVVEVFTIHKKDDTLSVLIHEIVHLFYGYSMRFGLTLLPMFNEGIANFIAKKKVNQKIDFDIYTLRTFKEDVTKDYSAGYKIIESIMDYFGEKGNRKILGFLKKINNQDSDEVLLQKFKEEFGLNVKDLIEMKGGGKNDWKFGLYS